MNWIDEFIETTEHINSPQLFRKWAAISIIACAMERKVWVHTLGSNLFPNLYIILVADPGIGKTEVTWRAREYIQSLEGHHLANSSITAAALIDDLADATRRIVRPTEDPPILMFNSLSIIANELGVLLPAYEPEFMNILQDLYDCKAYSQRRRHMKGEPIKINMPQLNILAACTPDYLRSTLPVGAWDQGFLSRSILVYSGERKLRGLFDVLDEELISPKLKERLAKIGNMVGQFRFTEEAATTINNWHMSGNEPRPEHPKLHHYSTRRTAHALKIAMAVSAGENERLVITKDNVMRSIDLLVEVEGYMPEIFKSMSAGGDSKVIEDAWFYLFEMYQRGGRKPIPEYRLITFLQERTPAHNVMRIVEVMVNMKLVEMRLERTGKAYVPAEKRRID